MYSYCGVTQGRWAGALTLPQSQNNLLHNWTEYLRPTLQVNNTCKED